MESIKKENIKDDLVEENFTHKLFSDAKNEEGGNTPLSTDVDEDTMVT